MPTRRALCRFAASALLVVAASCVGPARTSSAYEADAVATADEVRSAAGTARLAIQASRAQRITANYLTIVLVEAEDAASSSQAQFESVQPPAGRADELRAAISPMLDATSTVLTDLRIAVRRSNLEALPRIAKPLDRLIERLDAFSTKHEK